MSPLDSLEKRAGTLVIGVLSFVAILAVIRLSNGEPLVQPPGDIGIVIGAVLIALFFVISDASASKFGPGKGRVPRS
ncbi:MAG: hypothetical protein ACLPN5_16495 [Roseiarcus sp.]